MILTEKKEDRSVKELNRKKLETELQELKVDFDGEFIQRLTDKIDWEGLKSALKDLHEQHYLEKIVLPETPSNDEENLQILHHLLTEIKIIEGSLQCPQTGRFFPVKDGIPQMIFEEAA